MSTNFEASFKILKRLDDSYVDVGDENLSSLNSVDTSYRGTIDKVLQHYYENGLHTDVDFHVRCGDGYIRFSCHKLVLSLWSPVFAKMFFKKESDDIVEIFEVTPSAFEVMIKYCYGFETELQKFSSDVSFLLKVFKGAEEYKIKSLQSLCCEIFSCALPTKDNVFELLNAASFIGSESLKHRCYKVIQTQTRQIIELRELCDVRKSVIDMILNMSSLSLDSEYELIRWVFDWGSQESKKEGITFREVMADFLPRLNFLSLTPKEFGLLVCEHDQFFDEKEGFAIFMNIVCPESFPLPPWFGRNFNRTFHDSLNHKNLNISIS